MILNVTRILRRCVLSCIFFLSFFVAIGQPDFRFENGQLVSGTDRRVGAVYKYSNVKPGVDARVTITAISAGVQVVEMDGASGYPEALQPTLKVNPRRSGYLDMQFQFYIANTLITYTAPLLNVTCIDVDGVRDNDGQNNPVYEFDDINLGGGYVDFDGLGGELVISHTGNRYIGKNIGAIDYPGRDTAAKQVMFTVVNASVSRFNIRVGVDNRSNESSERLRSIYFKKFFYANTALAVFPVTSFEAAMGSQNVNLKWMLAEGNTVGSVELERSYNAKDFTPIASYLPNMENNIQHSFAYTDNKPAGGIAYYRLKVNTASGKIEYSNVLCVKETASSIASLKVYPTLTNDNITVTVNTRVASKGLIQIIDLSGKVMKQQAISLQKGMSTTVVNGFESMPRGTYVVALRYENNVLSNLIIVR